MNGMISRTTVTFSHPFALPGLDESLPAGQYDLETELRAPIGHLTPEDWKASVLVHLHPRLSQPGLSRSMTVSLTDLESAVAKDGLTKIDLARVLFEDMLADPMVRLLMKADGVSETELRHHYAGTALRRGHRNARPMKSHGAKAYSALAERFAIQSAENEGMPIRHARMHHRVTS